MTRSHAKDIAIKSLELTAALDINGLSALMHQDIVMRFPFSPEGFPNRGQGKDECVALSTSVFQMLKAFEWIDLEAFATQDPEVVFVTARSKVETISGADYANQYFFKIVVRDGQIIEHDEHFNPLPVMAAFM